MALTSSAQCSVIPYGGIDEETYCPTSRSAIHHWLRYAECCCAYRSWQSCMVRGRRLGSRWHFALLLCTPCMDALVLRRNGTNPHRLDLAQHNTTLVQ